MSPASSFKSAKWLMLASAFVIAFSATAIPASAQNTKSSATSAASRAEAGGQVVRGKYLVEGVAMCGLCHTPHDNRGQADPAHPLEGAALWLNPAMPTSDWPLRAPRIGGTPPATDEQMVTLLTTGLWIDGKRLRPPMPQFRMSKEDAAAVVAYLRSMKTSVSPAP